jgi:diacylglycerol kinase family enzyme
VIKPGVVGRPSAAPSRRVRVIRNTSAGSKGGIPVTSVAPEALRAVLARHGLGDDVVETRDEAEAAAIVRAAIDEGIEVIVAAGGDGTVALVANEVLGSDASLGILPLGSVMNVARSLHIPRDVDTAAAILAGGRTTRIDIGDAAGTTFYGGASVGLNAAIFREADHFDDPDWLSIVRTIWVAIRYRPARMVLQLDDRLVRTRALMVAVSNGPYTGAGMTVAPDARLNDGRFDVRVFRGFSKWCGSPAPGRCRSVPISATLAGHPSSSSPVPPPFAWSCPPTRHWSTHGPDAVALPPVDQSGSASGRRRMNHSVNSRHRPSSSKRQTKMLANSRSISDRSSVR